MVESTWLPIRNRIFSHEELCSDPSIRSVCFLECQDWQRVHTWYKAVDRMPLPASSRLFIKDRLLRSAYFAAYELDSPYVVIFRWPSGEFKYFLITAEGCLVDPAEHSIWDGYFPSLKRFPSGELRGLSIPSPVSYLPLSNWIWYPSNANYSHFLLDAFVQMAMAQELLSSDYLRGFELPLDVDAPVWQDELLQKLIFPRCMLPVGNSLSQYQIFRVNKLLLPIISSKAFGLDWLRVFLAKSFQPTHGFSFRGDQSKLIMVTRHDARRERIQNISSIEEMVLNFGGKVIDASSLSCSEKLDVFQSCLICIAESSGCMNPALFAPEYTQLFALTDPSVIASKYALVGAWPYFTGYAHRAQFVGGENGMFLPGSTVGSSSYSVDAIKKLVLEFL